MIATTPKQSAQLLEFGVNPNTADMTYMPYGTLSTTHFSKELEERGCTPAWSLSALLTSVLPKQLEEFPFTKWRESFYSDEICEMDSEGVLNGDLKIYSNGSKWIVDYDWDGFSGVLPQSENPIEAAMLAIELLHANNFKFI